MIMTEQDVALVVRGHSEPPEGTEWCRREAGCYHTPRMCRSFYDLNTEDGFLWEDCDGEVHE